MSFRVTQNLFLRDSTTFSVVKCHDDAVSMQHLQPLLDAAVNDRVLGISASYAATRRLSTIAFSTRSLVLVVNLTTFSRHTRQATRRQVCRSRSLIQDHLLLNRKFEKYAIEMDQLAVALYLDLSIRIDDAVDMLSVCVTDNRKSLEALMKALGEEAYIEKKQVQRLFFNASEPSISDVALKAWATHRAATLPHIDFEPIPRINTKSFPKEQLLALATISRNADCIDALKPMCVKNNVKEQFSAKKDTIQLQSERFSTRIRQSTQQVIQIEIAGKGATNQLTTGRTQKVMGRTALININEPIRGDKVVSVTTIGKDLPTSAEYARQIIILQTLQHRTSILRNPFFQALWLSVERPSWSVPKEQRGPVPVHFSRELNPSQHRAVQRILSDKDDDRVVLIQGPPGTGKTTVIAASVLSHERARSGQNIWIAAQSNVAVKNIAEKLVKEGFYKFRIFVSKDFHFDWHEHLYEQLERCLIRSDQFPNLSPLEAGRLLLDSKVILCTLSMLSNNFIGVFSRIVPVEMIILDEASQIESGDYLPVFSRFNSTLSKAVFIGDDKQLPPYGQEEISELRSIFEFPHLRKRASFLNIQYRMPHVIGAFISRHVYGDKLKTCHSNNTSDVCRFIDVTKGKEIKAGHSWINNEEVRVIVGIVRLYQKKGIKFRIITPYDAQRNLIEKKLKSEKLPWENKVFNVDSFQGNEEDHIIVSVVRTQGPGFLKNQRRTNVMLTRCKQSMVVCSHRRFLLGKASGTLVGKLAAAIDERNWVTN